MELFRHFVVKRDFAWHLDSKKKTLTITETPRSAISNLIVLIYILKAPSFPVIFTNPGSLRSADEINLNELMFPAHKPAVVR